MININNLIKMYASKLTKDDIITFIKNNNYYVSNQDIDIIYFYLKNYIDDFLDNPDIILNKIKKDVSSDTYNIIISLYNKYKKKI